MICYVDGGYDNIRKANGYGSFSVFDDNNNLIDHLSFPLPEIKSNNEAEYQSLLILLRWLEANNHPNESESITIFTDSNLMVNQVNGYWKVRAANLAVYHEQVHLPDRTALRWVKRTQIVKVLGH